MSGSEKLKGLSEQIDDTLTVQLEFRLGYAAYAWHHRTEEAQYLINITSIHRHVCIMMSRGLNSTPAHSLLVAGIISINLNLSELATLTASVHVLQ